MDLAEQKVRCSALRMEYLSRRLCTDVHDAENYLVDGGWNFMVVSGGR